MVLYFVAYPCVCSTCLESHNGGIGAIGCVGGGGDSGGSVDIGRDFVKTLQL